MTVAKKINKVVSIKKQTALGSAASGSGGSVLTRNSAVFSMPRDTFESNVITTHQQSTGVSYGMKRPAGRIDSLLSTETFSLLIAAALRKDFAAVSAYAAGTDVTASASGPHFVDASAGFLTAGLKVGMVGRWGGFTSTAAANNGKNFLITALTAGNMTGVFLNGDAVVAASSGDDVTFTPTGKFSYAPASGHTNDFFSVEEWYADISKSELYTDARVNSVSFGAPASGNATFGADLLALGRTKATSQALTSPTEPTFREMTSVNGAIYCNGSAVGNVTGVSLQIDTGASVAGPVMGSNAGIDVTRGTIKVTGSFTAMFDSTTIQDLYDAESAVSLVFAIAENEDDTSAFVAFSMAAIKMTGDAPDDGDMVVRTYPFTAEYYASGGSGTAWNQTILTVQDSQL